jgi:hypothetical protein
MIASEQYIKGIMLTPTETSQYWEWGSFGVYPFQQAPPLDQSVLKFTLGMLCYYNEAQ